MATTTLRSCKCRLIFLTKEKTIIFNQFVIPVATLGLTPVCNFQGPEKDKETNQLTVRNCPNY